MPIFSYHLAKTSPTTTIKAFLRPPTAKQASGLHHAECMAAMALGAPIFSSSRLQLNSLAFFAVWKDKESLDAFLSENALGKTLAKGWHVRLKLLRRWGHFEEFDHFQTHEENGGPDLPVVAVTLARLKLPHIFRFIRWGKPVEELVRDHLGTTLALAATRPTRTFSTFTVWRSQKDMTDMVHGLRSQPGGNHHSKAMAERNRKDFHQKFTTLRFRAISEHGEWEGRSGIIPSIS